MVAGRPLFVALKQPAASGVSVVSGSDVLVMVGVPESELPSLSRPNATTQAESFRLLRVSGGGVRLATTDTATTHTVSVVLDGRSTPGTPVTRAVIATLPRLTPLT